MENTPTLEKVLSKAFRIWWQTALYQILFSIIYAIVLGMGVYFLEMQYGIMAKVMQLTKNPGDIMLMQKRMQKIFSQPEALHFSLWLNLITVFLYPLNLGLYQIYAKKEKKEVYGFSDLISGYQGLAFFSHAGYFLFWIAVNGLLSTFYVLSPIWVLITMMVSPFMFFERKSIFNAIAASFSVLKKYPLIAIVGMLVAVIIKYMGVFLLVGWLLTLPFWMAVIYAIYTETKTSVTPQITH